MLVLIRKDQRTIMDSPSPPSRQLQSRLLSLPAELRNAIWSYLLVQTLQPPPSDSNLYTRKPPRFCANILQTCKQIHSEGTPILYGENQFLAHASLLTTLPCFLLRPSPHRVSLPPVIMPGVAQLIRRFYMHVRLDTDPRFSRLQVQESFTGVEELEVEVFQAMYGSCDFTVLSMFEDVRGVGKAVVYGSVGDGRYANWLARLMETPPGTTSPYYYERYIGGSSAWDAWAHGNR